MTQWRSFFPSVLNKALPALLTLRESPQKLMPHHGSDYVKALRSKLEPHSDPAYAVEMKAYLRNQFDFLGMKSPERKVLFSEFLNERGLPDTEELETIIFELLALPEREYHYFAIELAGKFKKQWTPQSVDLFEKIAVTRSWWDSVDLLKSVCLKDYFLLFPDDRYEVTARWINSGNIWLQRLSVIFQLGYREKTDTRLLRRNIVLLAGSEEFFVRKAIGWALRDYARTDPAYVIALVDEIELKPLSRREALKRLKP